MDRVAHAVMLAVMAGTMVVRSPLLSLLGAFVLIGMSVVYAALSRRRPSLHAPVLDLWAMALALVAFLPRDAPAVGHHVLALPALVTFGAVAGLWAAARIWLAVRRSPVQRGPRAWAGVAASAGLTAAGLALMAALCA